jgi:murein DD-endopeptidase MepM/ murein hydrolase activator NlpD
VRKRYYILFVARGDEGELRKIPIPVHYLYVFLVGALIGMLSITGMAGSYARMLLKVARFNELRTEKEALRQQYHNLEKVAQAKETQAAALSSLADEVSALYGLKTDGPMASVQAGSQADAERFNSSLDRFYALKNAAMTGVATTGIASGGNRMASLADWERLSAQPNLWPVDGHITGSFGSRSDPFNGEGAYHVGVDISTDYGTAVIAPADGAVIFADFMSGYGRLVVVQHSNGISTRYGHLSGFTVAAGQHIRRGDLLGYVGLSGRSTGPHLHYEVRLNGNPVNPHNYLPMTVARSRPFSNGLD